MTSTQPNLGDIQDRLLKVEKQNRRFKWLGAAVLAFVAVIAVMGQVPSKKTVEANEFILRDAGGNVRAKLFVAQKSIATAKEVFGIDSSTRVTFPPDLRWPFMTIRGK